MIEFFDASSPNHALTVGALTPIEHRVHLTSSATSSHLPGQATNNLQ